MSVPNLLGAGLGRGFPLVFKASASLSTSGGSIPIHFRHFLLTASPGAIDLYISPSKNSFMRTRVA